MEKKGGGGVEMICTTHLSFLILIFFFFFVCVCVCFWVQLFVDFALGEWTCVRFLL